jgi:hypothetical protein
MSLDRIRKIHQDLLDYLGFLEKKKIKGVSLEEEFKLTKKITICQTRLKFLAKILSGEQTLIGELPPEFSFETLLNEAWDDEIISQPVTTSDLDSEPECQVFLSHLIVAIFWQQRSKKKVRVQLELCYHHPETRKCVKESLAKDTCSLSLTEFPKMLEELTNFTSAKLFGIFRDSLRPWQLTIELFVPIDLLCFPLARWCYKSSRVIQTHAITIRCSDRFDPDRPGESADLHNQLKAGWQRFQHHVPDKSNAKLRDLNWLQPPQLGQENLENYSGLKCFGNWLKPPANGATCLERWEKVIRSGIPLALWICQGQSQPSIISQTYDQLTDCNRFEFLDRVRDLLNQQKATPNYHVGVFYEDPNYVPTVPTTQEQQYFSWPGTA